MTAPVTKLVSLEEAVWRVLAEGGDPNEPSEQPYIWAALLDDEELERVLAFYQQAPARLFKLDPSAWVVRDALISETLNREFGIVTTFSKFAP
jgi:hypothetical protein